MDAVRRQGCVRVAGLSCVVVCASWVSAAPQSTVGIDALMSRVAERVAEYYQRAQSVICVERSTVQPIRPDWTPEGFSRTVESELRVESDSPDGDTVPKAHVIRDVRRVNGRAPRPQDSKDRSGCTDPNPLSPEPLTFLLADRRNEYQFTKVSQGRERDRAALIVEFTSVSRTSRPELIEDERGHDDCFDWTGPIATRGRLWVDASTHEVLRLDRRLQGPIDVQVPRKLQRSHNLPPSIVVERDDLTLRYKAVPFSDPDEILLVPESIESLTVVRTALQSMRRTETFSDYRRFLTTTRIVKGPAP
jgi:hypothetical protein